tara:strand:- start:2890 stop:4152 length:1263 start_codon:yes stop_codon:yes gene_type:complete
MLLEIVYIVGALLAGGAMGWLLAKQKSNDELLEMKSDLARAQASVEVMAEEHAKSLELVKAEMKNFATEANEKAASNLLQLAGERFDAQKIETEKDHDARQKEVANLVIPIKDSLEKLQASTEKMEKEREGAYQGLKRTVEGLSRQTTDLRDTNVKLSTALRGSSKSRGDWGQISLRNVAESAGMTEHCDFDIEVTLASGAGGGRVDMVAKIPDGGNIPVDAKVPLAAYWDGLDLEDPDARKKKMEEHAKALKSHIDALVKRDYPSLMGGSDFTVMYIPAPPILAAAFEVDPTLQEYAFRKQILITTPVELLGLLRTVGVYWQQQSMAENAQEIQHAAREFYQRSAKFGEDLAKMGRGLNTAVNAYNAAVGSYDRRVIPAGRRLEGLRVADNTARKLEGAGAVDGTARIPENAGGDDSEE